MDLFNSDMKEKIKDNEPLAVRIRPDTIDGIIGQEHLFAEGKMLKVLIESDKVPSMILYGPPGTGKTTIAAVIASVTNRRYYSLNAVMSGVSDIRETVMQAKLNLREKGQRSILFIDEIHRFNKAQQDALLPYVEKGTVTLIGATTENPMFSLNGPLISRTRIFELKPLTPEHVSKLISKGLEEENKTLIGRDMTLAEDAREHLIRTAGGDARIALNTLELAFSLAAGRGRTDEIDLGLIEEVVQKRAAAYDKDGDNHYDIASALIKSIRGSDPDAAVYWLGRMIYSGEDPRFIARRLMISASEDIGMANPTGLLVATAAAEAVERIGMPEARIILGHTAVFLAMSPKSNSACIAIDKALDIISAGGIHNVPDHLRDAHYKGAERLNRGIGYKYPHDFEGHYVDQQYLPDELVDKEIYRPTKEGYEGKLRKKKRKR